MKVDFGEEMVGYNSKIWKWKLDMIEKESAEVFKNIETVRLDKFSKDQIIMLEHVGGQIPYQARFILWELHKLLNLNIGTREQNMELEKMIEQCQGILAKVEPITEIANYLAECGIQPKRYIPVVAFG